MHVHARSVSDVPVVALWLDWVRHACTGEDMDGALEGSKRVSEGGHELNVGSLFSVI